MDKQKPINGVLALGRAFFLAVFVIPTATWADVLHPDDPNIAGLAEFDSVCLNNDGAVASENECDDDPWDEGLFQANASGWLASGISGINGCGVGAVDPVSSASCPLTFQVVAPCTGDLWVLVQTTKSGDFWAAQANGACDTVTALTPCRKNDSFDPGTGCSPTTNPPQLSIDSGYLKTEFTTDFPPHQHCAGTDDIGRLVVDAFNSDLYVCTEKGWRFRSLSPIP